MRINTDAVISVVTFAAGLVGIGYAVGTRSKANELCAKLDRSIDELSDDISIEIPDRMIKQSVEKAVRREAESAVRTATEEVVDIAKREIKREVSSAVDLQRNTISEDVTKEIAKKVARIDENQLRKEAVAKAKEQIAEKFDGKLDDILDEFNGNLQSVGKIYKSIANSFTKETI